MNWNARLDQANLVHEGKSSASNLVISFSRDDCSPGDWQLRVSAALRSLLSRSSPKLRRREPEKKSIDRGRHEADGASIAKSTHPFLAALFGRSNCLRRDSKNQSFAARPVVHIEIVTAIDLTEKQRCKRRM
jgi:hypothetical protein